MREIQAIRGLGNKLLGRLYEDSQPGDQVIMDARGTLKGRYIKSSDSTFDHNGKKIGYGNLLMMLLKE